MPERYLVPQFIDVEPKMFGPITVRQFIILLYAGLIDFIIWKIFADTRQTLAIILIVLHTFVWGIIAFTKINGQNFHYFLLNIFRTLKKPKLRIWLKIRLKALEKEVPPEVVEKIPTKRLPPSSRLSDLALMVDTGGAYNVETEEIKNSAKVEEINI